MKTLGTELNRDRMPIVRQASLSFIAGFHSLRCDAKQAEERFSTFNQRINSVDHFQLGHFFPAPFIKGIQPKYLEVVEADAVPIINTLSVQRMSINIEACRYVSLSDFDNLDDEKKLRNNDVLLTVDGGTSIGKSALFDLDTEYSVDSHVAVLRPVGISPKVIVYLLASPLGQLQFQQAESGASGQTAVTEEDIRRFKFPKVDTEILARLVGELDDTRSKIFRGREELDRSEQDAWEKFNLSMFEVVT